MKKTFSIIGTILLLIIIAFAFGVNASMHGYQVTISSFLIGTSSGLAPDFSYNITAFDRVLSVIYMIAIIINQSSVSELLVPLLIMAFVMPIGALIARFAGKKLQY